MIEYENLAKVNAPFFDAFNKQFESCLKSGWYILGKEVEAFEQEFAEYTGANYCVGVASGLDALILSLAALELQPGDEVIVPSNTYIATVLAIYRNGLKPVFVEPDITTYNLNPDRIEIAISEKTKVVLAVHLYGKTSSMERISAVCRENNLYLIEDCAQSHGSMLNGKKSGTFGNFGAFSFYPTKNLGALGDGGAIVTDNETMYQKLKALRNYGSSKKYHNQYLGYNSRLDEVQAAFLRIKLKHLDDINTHKRKLAQIYFQQLNNKIILPIQENGNYDVFHIFNIRTTERDELRDFLSSKGIKTEIHYPIPPYKQEALLNENFGEYPISNEIHRSTLSLPISSFHTPEQIEQVAQTVNSFYL